jgi:hypothetical protein
MKRKFAHLSLLVGLLASVSCSNYGTTSRTAKDIKSIHVPFFENLTTEPNLEITVTESVIDNLVEDNTLRVSNRDVADAILEGKIVRFDSGPISFNQDLNAEEYRVLIRVNVTLYNRRTQEPIWSDKILAGDGNYFVENTGGGQTIDGAISESIQEITDRILNLTVQDW